MGFLWNPWINTEIISRHDKEWWSRWGHLTRNDSRITLMRIQEVSSTFDDNLEEIILSEWLREGSTPRSMSAIRINVEEASNGGEDIIRDVSLLRGSCYSIILDVVTSYLVGDLQSGGRGECEVEVAASRKSHMSPVFFIGRWLSISPFLPPFRCCSSISISTSEINVPRETRRHFHGCAMNVSQFGGKTHRRTKGTASIIRNRDETIGANLMS